MKKHSIFLTGLLFILIFSSFQQITAQEASKAEKQTEEEILKAIDEQKKAMAMQKKAQEDALVIIKRINGLMQMKSIRIFRWKLKPMVLKETGLNITTKGRQEGYIPFEGPYGFDVPDSWCLLWSFF